MTNQRIKDEHPSYGLLRFGRTRGGNRNLFGSSVEHNEQIEMTVTRARVERSLSNDWYGEKGPAIIRVTMSNMQFAEAITNLNSGSGIPCTLLSVGGERIEECPFTDKRKQFENEMREHVNRIQSQLDGLVKDAKEILVNKKSVGKGDRDTILMAIDRLNMELTANVPFVLEQFNEQMDKSVTEAKMEVDAYTTRKIQEFGFDKIKEMQQIETSNPRLIIEEDK